MDILRAGYNLRRRCNGTFTSALLTFRFESDRVYKQAGVIRMSFQAIRAHPTSPLQGPHAFLGPRPRPRVPSGPVQLRTLPGLV